MNPLLQSIPTQVTDHAACHPELEPYCEQLDALRRVGRMFHARGWSLGTSSNYSVVLGHRPCRLVITASGKDKGQLSRQDFVLVDGDGNPVHDGQPRSSAETMIHCRLAESTDVGAILHTHSVWATVLSDLYADRGGFWIEDYEMLKGLEGVTTHQHRAWVTIYDNSQDIPTLADLIMRDLAKPNGPTVHGFLLRHHGLYTWGRDLFAATRHVEIFEFLFECLGRRRSFPTS
jgi:methylthioribulose-1-phosphate dehydratase